MNCERCGARLKEGCLYCSSCGKEVQIVPDYNVEEEYLSTILKESSAESFDPGTDQTEERKQETKTEKKKKKKKKKRTELIPVVAVCVLLAAGITAGVSYKLYIDDRNANSYEYQVAMAEQVWSDQNFEDAVQYYQSAIALKPGDLAARFALADIYMTKKDEKSALNLYQEILEMDDANKTAYQKIIAIYESRKDYESIKELSSNVMDLEILELFRDYIVTEPVFSLEAGIYDDYITITLYSEDGDDIFYTTDGKAPDSENGILYREEDEISFEEAGDYVIKAVCRNEQGIYSDIETAEYTIDLKAPEHAKISPNGGRFEEETFVTITAEAGCSIYYTWDGSDPTTASARYTQALLVPEGNHILSVLVVNNKTKLESGVYRANFIYYQSMPG